MIRTYEYRIYPTPPQERRIRATLDACRFVYNWGLEQRKLAWEQEKKSLSYCDQHKLLPELKKEYPYLKQVFSHCLSDALHRLDKAFKAFFRRVKSGEKPGYPRFKAVEYYNSITFIEFGVNGALWSGKRLYLSKIGRVRIRLHRPTEGKVKTCTIKRKADGWYASFACELPSAEPSKIDNPIGIDLGLTTYATLSNGEKIENPRHLKKAEKELKKAQRRLSKKKKGSKRRAKAKKTLARKHLHLSRVRKDWQRKTVNELVKKYNPIYVEDLKIQEMQKKRKGERNVKQAKGLRRSIPDASWGEFLAILEHKAEWAGVSVIRVTARGTTQECSNCHQIVPKTLYERVHSCPFCGLTIDRDLNAALNILNRGRAVPSGRAA